jgi:uncharacterized protein YjiS (DUF1127 family)
METAMKNDVLAQRFGDLSRPVRGVVAGLLSAFAAVAREIEHNRAIYHLRALDDRLLKDMGIERDQIAMIVRSGGKPKFR